MMFCTSLQAGIQSILSTDVESQKYYLSIITKDVRGIELAALDIWKAFFVPNNSYIATFVGSDAYNISYGLYTQGDICPLCNKLVFPCYLPSGRLVGWVNFDPLAKAQGSTIGGNCYSFPPKTVFKRAAYLFTPPEIYKVALANKAIILTDGVFDAVSLVHNGFAAASFLGSEVGQEVLFQLRFFSTIYLAMDNDEAGLKLLRTLRKHHRDVRLCGQGWLKDADDVLKSDYKEKYISTLKEIAFNAIL